jgi:predicted RecA/RadA family phage recombinase
MFIVSLLAMAVLGLALMVAPGDRSIFSGDVKIAAPGGGVVRGLGYLIGVRVMVARETAAAGVLTLFAVSGPVTVTKATAVNFAIGDKVYWDTAAKNFTSVSAGNTLVGTALSAQVNADTQLDIVIEGVPPTSA